MGVEATKRFLEKFDLDAETKKKIINCVEAHHGQVPYACNEAEICANLDCYRFLHPRAFLEKFAFTEKANLGFDRVLDLVDSKLDEKYKLLSLDICKKELEKYYWEFKGIIKTAREL